jgi:hypothetical protein
MKDLYRAILTPKGAFGVHSSGTLQAMISLAMPGFRTSDKSSAAPGEKGRRTVGLVEIHEPRPPMVDGASHTSFSQRRVAFILPRMNLSNLRDFLFANRYFTVVLHELFHYFEIWHRTLYVSMLYRFDHHHHHSPDFR